MDECWRSSCASGGEHQLEQGPVLQREVHVACRDRVDTRDEGLNRTVGGHAKPCLQALEAALSDGVQESFLGREVRARSAVTHPREPGDLTQGQLVATGAGDGLFSRVQQRGPEVAVVVGLRRHGLQHTHLTADLGDAYIADGAPDSAAAGRRRIFLTRTTAFGPAVTAGIPTRTFPARAEGGVGGSAALLIAPAQFLLCEVVAAAAWRRPGYSYFRNFISDLGVTDGPMTYQGRLVDSPLGVLMNVSFFLLGIIGAYGIIMLTRSLPPSRHRGWLRLAGVAFGLGGILVGLFPENTIELAHAAGAFPNIGFGNVVLILVGARATRYYAAPPWVAWLLVGLGLAMY